jgi:predicted permease
MDILLKDLRHAGRTLIQNPGFTAVAVATLALGIGANTAIFTVVNTVLLRPLPVTHPDRLMNISAESRQRNITRSLVPAADFLDWKASARGFSGMSALEYVGFSYAEKSGAIRVEGVAVTPDFFSVVGATPLLGRDFLPEEAQPGRDDVVVIGETLWRNSLGANPAILGSSIRLNSRPFTVVGVMPAAMKLPYMDEEVWKPLALTPAQWHDRVARNLFIVASLREGVSAGEAQSEMRAIASNLARAYPGTNTDWSVGVGPLIAIFTGDLRQGFLLLLAAVSTVVLIGCLNLASLLSARIGGRQREVAIRMALGATRGRLLRQFLSESLLLSLAGGGAGILLALWSLPALVRAFPPDLPRGELVQLDLEALLYTLLVSIASGLLFGVTPAFQSAKTDLNSNLKEGSRGSAPGRTRTRFRDALVVAEVALSMVLLVGAGLLVRSLAALSHIDPGFRSENVLVNSLLTLPPDKYDTQPKRVAFFSQLLDRIRSLPGVKSAGGITALPLQRNGEYSGFRIAGQASPTGQPLAAIRNVVTEDYFATMGIPVRKGRVFAHADNQSAPRVALINEALARRDFANRDPIGQRLLLDDADTTPLEVAGVVGDSRQFGLEQPAAPEIFIPFLQSRVSYMYVLVHTEGNPENLAMSIRREVAQIDPDQPVGHRTLEQQLSNATAQPRFVGTLLGLFAGLALILAMVGIYGVTSYSVVQRTAEIGIRMALGEQRPSVIKLIVGRTVRLTLAGLALGAAASLILGRLMATLLYGVRPADPLTLGAVCVIVLAVSMLASFIPAQSASKLDPLIALRRD